jgi:hypothetical protein
MAAVLQAALEKQATERAAESVSILEDMEKQVLKQQDLLIESQSSAIEKIDAALGAGTAKKLLMEDDSELFTPPEAASGQGGGPSKRVSFATGPAESLMDSRMGESHSRTSSAV